MNETNPNLALVGLGKLVLAASRTVVPLRVRFHLTFAARPDGAQ